MPTFKTLERAERYGRKHCFTPIIKERKKIMEVIRMVKKEWFGYGMILMGFLILYAQIFILDKVTEPIRTIIGLSVFFCFVLPLVVGGSIVNETAPNFIMNRIKGG